MWFHPIFRSFRLGELIANQLMEAPQLIFLCHLACLTINYFSGDSARCCLLSDPHPLHQATARNFSHEDAAIGMYPDELLIHPHRLTRRREAG